MFKLMVCLLFMGFPWAIKAGVMAVEDAAMIAKLAEQIKLLEKQYQQMEKSYEAITGQPHLGTFGHDHQYRDYVSPRYQETYENLQTQGFNGLTPKARRLYEKNKVLDTCEGIGVEDERILCEARLAKVYQDQAYLQEALETSRARISQIEALMQKVDTTQDPKAVAELQARIGAEQAMISNEQMKLELLHRSLAAQDRMVEDKMNQLNLREVRKTGTLDLDVMEFENSFLDNVN